MSTRNRSRASHVVGFAALGGVIGPVVFISVVVLGGVLYEGYSHVGQKISELGGEGAEFAVVQNLNFILLGVSVIGFAWALARVIGPPVWGPLSIGVFGLSSAIGSALLPCDVTCQGATTVGLLHNVSGLVGFVAAVVGMLVLARRWRADPSWSSHARFTKGMAIIAVVGLVGFVITEATATAGIAGIVQRVFVSALLLWVTVTAIRMIAVLYRADAATSESTVPAALSTRGGIHG